MWEAVLQFLLILALCFHSRLGAVARLDLPAVGFALGWDRWLSLGWFPNASISFLLCKSRVGVIIPLEISKPGCRYCVTWKFPVFPRPNQLSGLTPLFLPGDRPPPWHPSPLQRTVEFDLPGCPCYPSIWAVTLLIVLHTHLPQHHLPLGSGQHHHLEPYSVS
jgi:hypothetical protein